MPPTTKVTVKIVGKATIGDGPDGSRSSRSDRLGRWLRRPRHAWEPTLPCWHSEPGLVTVSASREVPFLSDDATVTEGRLRLQARRLAEAIVTGQLPPSEGARRIWTEVWSESPADLDDLAVFVNDATDWEETPDRRPEIEEHIRSAAKSLLERSPRAV